jgi:hypothetical protein
MEENLQPNEPRKLRKIKRARPAGMPTGGAYGMPTKVNYSTPNVEDNAEVSFIGSNGDIENIRLVTEEDLQYVHGTIADYLRNKTVLLLVGIAMLFGMILGYMFMPKGSSTVSRGLDGVVLNEDVPAGRSRCGLTEPHQACVLYIMNPKNQEVTGRDFYTTAAKWTGRERYIIETGNMKYGNVRIKPGYIAQINIPSLSY